MKLAIVFTNNSLYLRNNTRRPARADRTVRREFQAGLRGDV